MYVLFVWWGDGSVTQTVFGTLELAQAGDAQLGGHQKAVDSLIVQVTENHIPYWGVPRGGSLEVTMAEEPEPLATGGRRGRKG